MTSIIAYFLSITVMHNEMQQQQQQQRSNGDGTLSPTSNQLARWFTPELLAQGMIKTGFIWFKICNRGRMNIWHFFAMNFQGK